MTDSWYLSFSSMELQKLFYRVVVSLVYPSQSIWVRHPRGKCSEVQLLIEGYIYPKC